MKVVVVEVVEGARSSDIAATACCSCCRLFLSPSAALIEAELTLAAFESASMLASSSASTSASRCSSVSAVTVRRFATLATLTILTRSGSTCDKFCEIFVKIKYRILRTLLQKYRFKSNVNYQLWNITFF